MITQVLLVDDHAMVRSGLALLVGSQPDMEVVGEAEEAKSAVCLTAELKPDIVVLDISMPGGNGLQVIDKILDASPDTRVLVLTMHDDYAYLRAAMAAGTSGYVVKTAAHKELLLAIRTLRQGRTYISVSLSGNADYEPDPLAGAEAPGEMLAELSKRETEVLEYVAYGYTSQQIADHLSLSVKTIDGYRGRITEKLGLRNRADLVRYALDRGILDRNRPPPLADDGE